MSTSFHLPYFIEAARPKTLLAALAPILVGLSLSCKTHTVDQFFYISIAIILCAVLIQVLTNYVNDLYDHKKGSDIHTRIGPRRLVSAGLISEREMSAAILILLLVILSLGSFLIYHGGLLILAIGIVSIISAIAYTAGPYPLAYNGLGDLFVIIFFGPIPIIGIEHLLTRTISQDGIMLGIAVGLLANSILLVNNCRDIEEDLKSNKLTLPARFGRAAGNTLYGICVISPFFIVLVVYFSHASELVASHFRLLPYLLLLLPYGLKLVHTFKTLEGGENFNKYLGKTSKFLLLFSIVLSILIFVS